MLQYVWGVTRCEERMKEEGITRRGGQGGRGKNGCHRGARKGNDEGEKGNPGEVANARERVVAFRRARSST